ncbi:unnamed protein product [Soboliphyme baturini]|uniref:Uncharacterized protein n=1 Tax=Soboliphyme baturini TaxID=241478 RepID=A0A183J3B9_9BILA|nr:unnamed protein product [Soboliphyme baturini]
MKILDPRHSSTDMSTTVVGEETHCSSVKGRDSKRKTTTFVLEPVMVTTYRQPSDTGCHEPPPEVLSPRHRQIRRVVMAIGVSLTVVCVILVAVSLVLGQRTDRNGKSPVKSIFVR